MSSESLELCSDELKPMVAKLISEFKTNLGHIDEDRIIYVKNIKGKKRVACLQAVGTPYNLFVGEKFILTVFATRWYKFTEQQRYVALFNELVRIKNFEESEMVGYSVVGNKETLETWGFDWDTEDEDIANSIVVFKDKR